MDHQFKEFVMKSIKTIKELKAYLENKISEFSDAQKEFIADLKKRFYFSGYICS